ncbi:MULTISPECIES: DUF2306 domain-containing protein [unclassified Paenibacillus]|uniref:DUF2306 domain-containing protein n=1 Tax=unclassified Paenibacillus TaxID=185978 RepID=UPI000953DBA9|nr:MULTISPECIES: DUF2306 domain-containing protein [unclassified Paenibacillus]ASS67443.2 DUF2306 domain-containing protein [Paenibacillus sp. RUD330]SIQ76846.1 Uncharacterized membrane protein [Paenibacillus sp. RU4X]SIQ98232.1 Uncharacterized membrane protein [Paenibacillus sp. RU4T]
MTLKTRAGLWSLTAAALLLVFGYVLVQYGIAGARQAGFVNYKLQSEGFSYTPWIYMLYVHIVTASAAMLGGLYALLRPAAGQAGRTGSPSSRTVRLHRLAGRIYAVSVALSSLASLYLAFKASGGWIAGAGFLLMDALWLATTIRGVRQAMLGRIAEHRRWMIRSYALTFSGVSLRVLLAPLTLLLGSFNPAYQAASWLCWLANLAAAEWIIRRSRERGSGLTGPTVGIQ